MSDWPVTRREGGLSNAGAVPGRGCSILSLMSHGIREDEASKLIVNGLVEPIVKKLPMGTQSR